MQKATISKKTKSIIYIIAFIIVFIAGIASHDTLKRTKDLTKDLFFPAPKPYQAPLSEYEQATQKAFNDPKHQATCLAQAKANVSLELVGKYLKETKKQQVLASYDLPLSLVGQ